MDAGINNIIYMELHSGPKMANGTCGETIIAGTIDRGSTVHSENVTTEMQQNVLTVLLLQYEIFALLTAPQLL
jgi:hypothetical protein